MSSQRSRQQRAGPRAGGQEHGEEVQLWAELYPIFQKLDKLRAKSDELCKEIIEKEASIKSRETAGTKPSPDELSAVQELFRQNVKVCEEIKALNDSEQPYERLQILTTMKSHTEQQAAEASKARASASRDSRSTMDFDGPSDSPVPSPAENKQIRKVTASRSGSQPPKETKDERDEKESNDRSKTKVTFALGAEVAFRPKIQGSSEEHDWILGKVTKVIGEGKSRRYDVQDAEPDDPKNPSTYRSSASSMAKITPVGTPLADYEVGKKVLALYPETSTFYRAEVMGTVDNGERVQLLFAEEDIGALKYVERRFVLDHKG